MTLHRSIAWALVALGALHLVLGIYWSWEVWVRIARDGSFDAIDPWMDRNAAFWFTYLGLPIMFAGALCLRLLKDTAKPLPPTVAYWLLILGAIGTFFMPASGLVFLLILGALALVPVNAT